MPNIKVKNHSVLNLLSRYIHTTHKHKPDWLLTLATRVAGENTESLQTCSGTKLKCGRVCICWKEHVFVLHPATATTMHNAHRNYSDHLFTWFKPVVYLRTVIRFINWPHCVDDGWWSNPHRASAPQRGWSVGKYWRVVHTIHDVDNYWCEITYYAETDAVHNHNNSMRLLHCSKVKLHLKLRPCSQM